ncbi:uncharacterized protein TNCV_2091901 [Trichonephila clavipes]|nr:uncharacterized protein TNCV_2091901 [Trichonephila clavipes]
MPCRKRDKKVEKWCKFIKCYCQISIRVHERISSREKTLQNTLLMPSLMSDDGNAVEILLMTAQINTDFVNHPVPSSSELSTSLVRVETDSCESIINSILPCKDYDSHKNAYTNFQKRFIDNPFDHGCSICDRLWFRDDL